MISVLIPAKDAAETIEKCLRSVFSQRYVGADIDVIVIDDGSIDRTGEIAKRCGARVIRQDHSGPAVARNAGAKIAWGDVLVFTDADCVPDLEWLHNLLQPFVDPLVVGTKGTYQTHQSSIVPRFVQQEYGFKYQRMARQKTIDFIDTYSAAYRREVFQDNGGFDSAFAVPSVEDQEFSFRLARKGYRMAFAPRAVVYHQHDRDIREYLQRKFGIGYWKAFMLRWLPEKAFGDSHTPPSLIWQILFLAIFLLTSVFVLVFWRAGWWLVLLPLILFYISALPFLRHLSRKDPDILVAAPFILLLRAGALGFGLASGFLFPPRTQPRTYTGLSPLGRFLKRVMDIWEL